MKNITKIIAVACLLLLMSCNKEPSIQEYFVSHQEDRDFIAVDIPSSLLNNEVVSSLDKEEKEALESIKKINFLLLPLKDNDEKFTTEKSAISRILNSDQYQTLIKFGSDKTSAVLKYQGEEDAIDEIIVFASDQEKGLALARVLGDDMTPEKMIKLTRAVENGGINLDAFKNIAKGLDLE